MIRHTSVVSVSPALLLPDCANHLKDSTTVSSLIGFTCRKHFDLLPHTSDQPMSKFDSSSFDDAAKGLITTLSSEVLQMARSKLEVRRNDYLEFVELCTVFLDGVEGDKIVTLKRPGALHKARWMAKLLYSIKICLL